MSKKPAFTDEERRQVWLLASGALNAMQSCHESQGYWSIIENFDRQFPNPNDHQIHVDLTRTFPGEDEYQNKEMIEKLRRVCKAYSVRNPEIGYCQGFNFIVGRFLKIMSEEEAFWMLTMLLESFIPLDYYAKLIGVLIDNNILKALIEERMPDLHSHLEEQFYDPSSVTFQWICCLFANNFSYHVIAKIWDLFFLKGSKILFRISLAMLHMMKPTLMQAESFEQIQKSFDKISSIVQDARTIIQVSNMPKYKLKNKEIKYLRQRFRAETQDQHQKDQRPLVRIGQQSPQKSRSNFLSKFYMYSSIQKTAMNDKLLNMKLYKDGDLVSYCMCDDEKWPVCFFDFSFQQRLPNFFAYRPRDYPGFVDENYFYGDDGQAQYDPSQIDRVINMNSMLFQSQVTDDEDIQNK